MLRNRATNLEAEMNDGTTPLILAAKHNIPDMVKDLIKAGVKVDSTDGHGNYIFLSVNDSVNAKKKRSFITI